MTNTGNLIVYEHALQTLVHRLRAGDSGGDREDDVMTTIEELRDYAKDDRTGPCCVYSISNLMTRAADELEANAQVIKLQKEEIEVMEAKHKHVLITLGEVAQERDDLRKQVAELTVKKTQVYKA